MKEIASLGLPLTNRASFRVLETSLAARWGGLVRSPRPPKYAHLRDRQPHGREPEYRLISTASTEQWPLPCVPLQMAEEPVRPTPAACLDRTRRWLDPFLSRRSKEPGERHRARQASRRADSAPGGQSSPQAVHPPKPIPTAATLRKPEAHPHDCSDDAVFGRAAPALRRESPDWVTPPRADISSPPQRNRGAEIPRLQPLETERRGPARFESFPVDRGFPNSTLPR